MHWNKGGSRRRSDNAVLRAQSAPSSPSLIPPMWREIMEWDASPLIQGGRHRHRTKKFPKVIPCVWRAASKRFLWPRDREQIHICILEEPKNQPQPLFIISAAKQHSKPNRSCCQNVLAGSTVPQPGPSELAGRTHLLDRSRRGRRRNCPTAWPETSTPICIDSLVMQNASREKLSQKGKEIISVCASIIQHEQLFPSLQQSFGCWAVPPYILLWMNAPRRVQPTTSSTAHHLSVPLTHRAAHRAVQGPPNGHRARLCCAPAKNASPQDCPIGSQGKTPCGTGESAALVDL